MPRDFRVAGDGSRVAFLRSSGPFDPLNALWVLDLDSGSERLVADPGRLAGAFGAPVAGNQIDGEPGDGEPVAGNQVDRPRHSQAAALPRAERERRERTRETAGGIVAYDTDENLNLAVFALAGSIWKVDLGSSEISVVPTAAGAFDPRMTAQGARLAYVTGAGLRVVELDLARGDDRLLIAESPDTVSWGSAEFVAAEEMGRTRGHWWSPDGRRLIVERVDVAPVGSWWIAAPVAPARAPSEIRYPCAGTANAEVSLAIFTVTGTAAGANGSGDEAAGGTGAPGAADRVDVDWRDRQGWEYLADVVWSEDGLQLVVQSRDQRTLALLQVDPESGSCRELYRVDDERWVELVAGAPRIIAGRLVSVEDRGPARRLCIDGEALTPAGLQVRSVVGCSAEGVVVTASAEPADIAVIRVGFDGALEWLAGGPGVHGAVVAGTVRGSAEAAAGGGETMVLWRRGLDQPGPEVKVRRTGGVWQSIPSRAADPGLDLNVEMVKLGCSGLSSAIVLPAGSGTGPLPVLLDPYGGPHAQRVQGTAASFLTSQWFANQGFAVVVIDGRGTPGRSPEFERAIHGDLATVILDDQIEGLSAAAEHEPRLDLSRVAIRGWSFGGYLATLAVLRRPDVFHAAVAGAPVTDWRLYDTHYTERYLGDPVADAANYEGCDLTPLAPGLRRPLLLIHGLADDNVVVAHTLQLSRALLEAGCPHNVLPLSGVTHMTPAEEVAENLLILQLDFLQKSLGLT